MRNVNIIEEKEIRVKIGDCRFIASDLSRYHKGKDFNLCLWFSDKSTRMIEFENEKELEEAFEVLDIVFFSK